MSVADRLRIEAEQALASLQETHSTLESRLAQALDAQRDEESELESLKAEHKNVSRKLAELSLQQQDEQAELNALRNLVKEITDCGQQAERQSPEEGEGLKQAEEEHPKENETDANEYGKEHLATQVVDPPDVDHFPDMVNESDSMPLTGKGVAEEYIRCLAAEEKKKERQRDPRKIVMLSERSWWVDVNFFFQPNLPNLVEEQYLQNNVFQESLSAPAPKQPADGKWVLQKNKFNIAAMQGLLT